MSLTLLTTIFSQEVAEICYVRLNLILIAMEDRKYEGGNIWLNPQNKKVGPNSIGLFITKSSDSAKRAWFYCRVCHENVVKIESIRRCSCKKLARSRYDYVNAGNVDNRREGWGLQPTRLIKIL